MGIEYSFFSILNDHIKSVDKTETKPDGTIIKTNHNPYVSIATISSLSIIMMIYLDGGKGMISKICGKSCVSCHGNL